MNKITKASIAAGAGVILLLGGGGTLAYWNASTTAGSASITSGTLSVAAAGSATATDQNGATVDSTGRAGCAKLGDIGVCPLQYLRQPRRRTVVRVADVLH